MKRLLVIPLLLVMGCASQNYVAHPGAINTFDSQAYDSLLVTHAVIEATKADLAAGKFPGSIAAGVRLALNGLVTSYNIADTSYLTYHTAAAAGTSTPAQQEAVSSSIDAVNTATSQLASAKGAQ